MKSTKNKYQNDLESLFDPSEEMPADYKFEGFTTYVPACALPNDSYGLLA